MSVKRSDKTSRLRSESLTRSESLLHDLKSMVNNREFSDVTIRSNDERELYGLRLLLAARSDVFNRMFLNGMQETTKDTVVFPGLSYEALHGVLEYLYTERATDRTLTSTTAVEIYLGAEFFILPGLKNEVTSFINTHLNLNANANETAKMLSKAVKVMPPSVENTYQRTICQHLGKTKLEKIAFPSFTADALELLLRTIGADDFFATSEYGVLWYVIAWAENKLPVNEPKITQTTLPHPGTLDELPFDQVQKRFSVNRLIKLSQTRSESIREMIAPFLPHVRFDLIPPLILANALEPLGIISADCLLGAYRCYALTTNGRSSTRYRGSGVVFKWDARAHGPKISINGAGAVARSLTSQMGYVRASRPIHNNEVVDWDIVIEDMSAAGGLWIGICCEKGHTVDYTTLLGSQPYGWVMGSNGTVSHNSLGRHDQRYGPSFAKDARISVHLNMPERTIAFSVNGNRQENVPWSDIPDEVYPAVAFSRQARVRIEPYKKA